MDSFCVFFFMPNSHLMSADPCLPKGIPSCFNSGLITHHPLWGPSILLCHFNGIIPENRTPTPYFLETPCRMLIAQCSGLNGQQKERWSNQRHVDLTNEQGDSRSRYYWEKNKSQVLENWQQFVAALPKADILNTIRREKRKLTLKHWSPEIKGLELDWNSNMESMRGPEKR